MGLGNGVFHPADFAILNANVAPKRLGHAYSMHGVGGNLGYALAPIVSYALAQRVRLARRAGGRWALTGLVALGVLATQRASLDVARRRTARTRIRCAGSVDLFRQPAILLCFAYFVDLDDRHRSACRRSCRRRSTPRSTSRSRSRRPRSPRYLLGGTAGIVAGGFLAARTTRHDRVAATGLLAAPC